MRQMTMNQKPESQQPDVILVGVAKKRHNQFKSSCAMAGVSMKQAIQVWMRVVNDDPNILLDYQRERDWCGSVEALRMAIKKSIAAKGI